MGDEIKATSIGVITEDPASGAPVGAQMRFLHVGFPPHPGIRTEEITNWDFFQGVVLSTNIADERSQRVWGSAVVVAPGVAIAARHVLDPELEGLVAGDRASVFSGIASHGVTIWRPVHVTPIPGTDLAVISLNAASALPPDGTYRQAALTTRIPKVGEPIMVLGFVSNEQEFDREKRGFDWDGRLVMGCGKVLDHFEKGTGQKPWPMLATDIESLGGMSGGPAFDKDGKLIGVLCSGAGEGENAYSLISLLWPCLPATITLSWLKLNGLEHTSLIELAQLGICKMDRPDAIATGTDANGNSVVHLMHWE